MTSQEHFDGIVALPRAQRATEVERLEPSTLRDEVRRLVAAHQQLEDGQALLAAAVVSRFTSALMESPSAQMDLYLRSPEIADWYRIDLFKALLKAERQHREDWNARHPQDQLLPVSYESYWGREWFRDKQYSLAMIVVLLEKKGYTFKEEIGTGGMGRVLLVRRHDRDEALKIVNTASRVWDFDEPERKRFLARFERESRVLSQISQHSPDHLPTLYHVDRVDGLDYFTMAYVPGPTLSRLLEKESWTASQIISRMLPLARLVHSLHTATELRQDGDCWIHRDLHPDNFIWDEKKQRVYLIDFGLARQIKVSGVPGLTEPGTRAGRPGFWPPEQASKADERSDVFTFAATLYFLLTKSAPKKDGGLDEFPIDPPSHLEPSVPNCLDRVLVKALEREPGRRYQTMAELTDALELCQTALVATTREVVSSRRGNGLPFSEAGMTDSSRRDPDVRPLKPVLTVLLGLIGVLFAVVVVLQFIRPRDLSPDRIEPSKLAPLVSAPASIENHYGSLDRVRQRGELRIATEDQYPPMTYRKDGQLVGFDVDFANELARRLGVKAVFVPVKWEWQPIVNKLNAHEFDVVISTVTETNSRLKQVEFVEYLRLSTALVSKKGLHVKAEEDLRGRTVIVQDDTRAKEWVEDLMQRGFNVKRVPDSKNAADPFTAIREGKAEITFAHAPVALYYANRNPEFEVSTSLFDHPEDKERIGVALCQDDEDLRKEVNRHVINMSNSLFIGKLYEKWIKSEIDGVVRPLALEGIPQRAVIAHRGASYDAPESTAASYLLARELGAHYLELDLQRTKDHELVAIHDDDLKRTTDVAQTLPERVDKPVSDFTLAELKRLDAGTWFNRAHPEKARLSYENLKILTLDEVIDIAEGGRNKPGLYIETKKPDQFPGIEKQLKDNLERRGWIGRAEAAPPNFDAKAVVGVAYMPGRVVLQTFEKGSLELLHQHMPEVPKVLLLWVGDGGMEPKSRVTFENSGETATAIFYAKQEVKSPSEFVQWLDWAKSHGAIGIGSPSSLTKGGEQSYMDLVQPWMNQLAHDRSLLVHAYTVDDKEDFKRLSERGVDGFFTNRPAELLKFYGRLPQGSIDAILKRHGY